MKQSPQRLALQPLAVVCLCLFGLNACATDEKVIGWQQDKPQVHAQIQAVQHEQQIAADLLQQHNEALENLQQKLNSLEQTHLQYASKLETLSKRVEELHRIKKTKAHKKAKQKSIAKTKVKHPLPPTVPAVAKRPPSVAAPVIPKINQAVIDEAEKNAYTAAYLALKSGRFEEASQAFNKQLDLYPNGQYANQAWYWLGETRLAQGNNNKALNAFKYVADHYRNSVKHAASLLKLGQLTQSQHRLSEARSYYLQLIQTHPDSSLAEQARSALSNLAKPENQQ